MSQKLLPPFLSNYANSRGEIRLVKVRDCWNRGVITDNELIDLYKNWRDQNEYLVLCYHRRDFALEYRAIKCSKRGNDVYNWRINQKFKELEELAEFYGDNKIFDINQAEPKTNCLLVTFTYDTKLKNKIDAWRDISSEYNRAITRLRQKFGKISVLRVWESFRNGYPHIHAILLFDAKRFNVFEHWTTNNKSTYRIQEKAEFSKVWHSNVDVLAVSSVRGAVGYLIKYLKKVHSGESKHNLTLANLWINHKQSFAISGNFTERLASIRLDSRNLRNSKRPIIQTTLEGEKIKPKCVLVGIFSIDEIKQVNHVSNPKAWSFRIKKLPDKKSDLTDDHQRVARELFHANSGVVLASDIFSRSPTSEQEKMGRAISRMYSTNMNLGQICLLRYNLRDSFVPKNKYSGVLFSNNMVLPFVDEDKPKCYLCHEGFENIDKLKKHQQSVHKEFFEFHEKNVKREPAPGDVTVF